MHKALFGLTIIPVIIILFFTPISYSFVDPQSTIDNLTKFVQTAQQNGEDPVEAAKTFTHTWEYQNTCRALNYELEQEKKQYETPKESTTVKYFQQLMCFMTIDDWK